MSAFKSLTFAPMPERIGRDPRVSRRIKLIERLEEQRSLVKNPNYTSVRRQWQRSDDGTRTIIEVGRRVKPWWRTDPKGAVVLSVKYGFSTLEFEKGKTGIVVNVSPAYPFPDAHAHGMKSEDDKAKPEIAANAGGGQTIEGEAKEV